MSEKNNKKPQRKKKRRRNKKLMVSAASFITAAVVVIFCIYYVYYETDYFLLAGVDIDGNSTYSKEYILEKSDIESGKKIFDIDRAKIKDNLEKEVYIESVRVVYVLPNRIFLDISEREEKYQVFYRSQYIIIDKNGIVLRISNDKSSLLTIESYTDIVYNVGDSIQFAGVENNKKIFDAIEYLNNEYGSDAVSAYFVDLKNSFLFETLYGTKVRIDLSEDVGYQIVFAMKIINERLNNNLTVTGLIDFTKGDSPVYIEE
jgi:cell division protein FtsQ